MDISSPGYAPDLSQPVTLPPAAFGADLSSTLPLSAPSGLTGSAGLTAPSASDAQVNALNRAAMGGRGAAITRPMGFVRPLEGRTPTRSPGAANPPRKRGRPRDPEADGRILSAAAELLLARGFDNMTVDDVAAKARVGKATVYRRWSKKEDLALAAMQRLFANRLPTPDTGTLRGDLRESYLALLRFADSAQGRAWFRMSIGESLRDPRITALYRTAVEQAEATQRDIFRRAVARGEIRPGPRLDYAIQWLSGISTIRTVVGRAPLPVEEVDALVDFVLHGLSAR